jgi:hypothetical protein
VVLLTSTPTLPLRRPTRHAKLGLDAFDADDQ